LRSTIASISATSPPAVRFGIALAPLPVVDDGDFRGRPGPRFAGDAAAAGALLRRFAWAFARIDVADRDLEPGLLGLLDDLGAGR